MTESYANLLRKHRDEAIEAMEVYEKAIQIISHRYNISDAVVELIIKEAREENNKCALRISLDPTGQKQLKAF